MTEKVKIHVQSVTPKGVVKLGIKCYMKVGRDEQDETEVWVILPTQTVRAGDNIIINDSDWEAQDEDHR